MDSGGPGSAGRPLTAEEEALRRNTDCVYFLASPLTCKKGIECEFRHSEGARLNPRDCWYWMHGNCLNPKCSFRHPPLDGLYGVPATSGSAPPALQGAASGQAPAVQSPASYNSNKQSVPCYYFQKGLCLKGDRCPFMHGSQLTDPLPSQPLVNPYPSVTDTSQSQVPTGAWILKEYSAQQSTPKLNADKPVEVPLSSTNPVSRMETASSDQVVTRSFPYHPSENVHPRDQPSVIRYNPPEGMRSRPMPAKVPISSSTDLSRLPPAPEWQKNSREPDESLRESSPGFDVLVDDNGGDSDYFDNEDVNGRTLVHRRGKVDHVDNYQQSEYEPPTDSEREKYNRMSEYDQHEQLPDQYAWDQRTSAERIRHPAYIPERRALQIKERTGEIDGSDLRHQLLKQRRLNNSRLAVSPERHGEPYRRNDRYVEERHHRNDSQRDRRTHHLESSISTRLQGRITIPRRYSPVRHADGQAERERDRRRPLGRLSPGKPIIHHGRHHDKIRGRLDEVLLPEGPDGRSLGGSKRGEADNVDFAGPKSLAELKGAKVTQRIGSSLPTEHKGMKLESHLESEVSLSFEGPKPLSTILKRKREIALENGQTSSSIDESIQKDQEAANYNSATVSASDLQSAPLHLAASSSEEHKDKLLEDDDEEEEGQIHPDDKELVDGLQSTHEDLLEAEGGMMADNMEEQILQNSDNGDEEEPDYEAIEGADYKTVEDDDAYQDEDFDDEEDFATKVGLMFS